MGASTANISRDMFNEQKEYKLRIFQQGPNKPLVDADINAAIKSLYEQIRRNLQFWGIAGSPDNGFKVQESLSNNVNNFTLKGGDGTADGSGRLYLVGHLALLFADVEWDTNGSDAQYIHDRSTGLTATVLSYSAGNWNVNELAGRTLYPNTNVGTGFPIVSNTQTTIVIGSGDMTTVAQAKDFFRVDPSTPSAPRTDIVYLDIYLDEVDSSEDSNLLHPLSGGSSFESAVVMRLRHIVRVRENSTTVPTSPFTDADSNIHYYVKLATLTRDANNTITAAEISDDVARDIISLAALRAEIIAARGSAPNLDARLDVSLKESGVLQDGIIVDIMVNALADIAQSKISESAVYDDNFVGVPSDLEDDLNQVRTEIKEAKGTASWTTAPTRDMETLNTDLSAVETELLNARGAFPTGELDDRLDVSLNEDGTLKASAISPALPKLAAEPSMVFYPVNADPYQTYRLHQFRGMFAGDYQTGARSGPYTDYGLDFVTALAYPLDVNFPNLSPGPGRRDNDPNHGLGPQFAWYFVYLIGKASGERALVYSTWARPPWTVGPLLDSSVYDFPGNGWRYWKFIAAVRNLSDTGWELIQIRKIGNHVEYEIGHRAFGHGTFGDSGWQDALISVRVPPTAMRINVECWVEGRNGTQDFLLRPPNPAAPSLGIPGLHEPANWPPPPPEGFGLEWKLRASSFAVSPGPLFWDNSVGWVDLNNVQEIGYRHVASGTDHNAYIDIHGYEEWTDFESSAPTW